MASGNKYVLCTVSLDANFIIVNIYKSLSQVSFLWFNVSLLATVYTHSVNYIIYS